MRVIKNTILFFVVMLMLFSVRLMTLIVPYKSYSKLLNLKQCEGNNGKHKTIAMNYGRRVNLISNILPFKTPCLTQVITAQWLLKLRRISTTIVLGLKKNEETGELEAHAWCKYGELIINGEEDRGGFHAF